MSNNSLFDTTVALRKRLDAAVGADKVFVGPLDDQNITDAHELILFLYRIAPNPSLRNREHHVPSGPDSVEIYRNSLPLDLHYLLTVGRNPHGSEETFLTALGKAMQALQLDPDLVGAALGLEAAHVSLDPLTTEEISRVWALFPTANYRTSVAYLVSPVWIDPLAPEVSARRVERDRVDVGARSTQALE